MERLDVLFQSVPRGVAAWGHISCANDPVSRIFHS